ncbi:MAG: hypothetical protein V4760_07195, partial [Bdellovibrionota bacterium]
MPKKLVAVVAFIGATALGMSAVPTVQNVCAGFLPENTMKIPVGTSAANSGWFAARAKKETSMGAFILIG